MIVGVGDTDPYQFDAGMSQVIATSLEIPTGEVAYARRDTTSPHSTVIQMQSFNRAVFTT